MSWPHDHDRNQPAKLTNSVDRADSRARLRAASVGERAEGFGAWSGSEHHRAAGGEGRGATRTSRQHVAGLGLVGSRCLDDDAGRVVDFSEHQRGCVGDTVTKRLESGSCRRVKSAREDEREPCELVGSEGKSGGSNCSHRL